MNSNPSAHYLRMAADICALRHCEGQLQILLIRRAKDPFMGCWAIPGGRLESDENLDQCALRELEEETGLKADSVRLFGVFSEPNRDPRERTVSACYIAWIPGDAVAHAASDATDVQWFSFTDLPDLAFDHDKVLQACLSSI